MTRAWCRLRACELAIGRRAAVGSSRKEPTGRTFDAQRVCDSFAADQRQVSRPVAGSHTARHPGGVVPEARIADLLGFNFHRGIIACGLRRPPLDLRQRLTEPLPSHATLVAMQGVQDPENMGGILRSCAALGIEHILIGPWCADPLSRRVLRVSMGTVLKLNLYATRDVISDLSWLKERHHVESIATTLADDSVCLEQTSRQSPVCILMGNEAHGLPIELQQAADHRVKIDMSLGTDSLNVSVAAGIVMHYYCRVANLTKN